MDKKIFNEIVETLIGSQKAGFGYIEDFYELIEKFRIQLNVSNAVLFWKYSTNGTPHQNIRYLNGQKFSLDCFDLDKICNCKCYLDSRRDDLRHYKLSHQLDGFHTIIIPIQIEKGKELLPIKGFILLLTISEINISLEELEVIYTLVLHSRPKTLDYPSVIASLDVLMENDDHIQKISLEHRYTTILKSLDILSTKGNENLNQHGLRHFSFWSYDNTKDLHLTKEFNKNTFSEIVHKDTHCILHNQKHYVLDYLKRYHNDLKELSFEEQILFYDYSNVDGSFKDKNYFEQLELNEHNTIIAVVPITFRIYTIICCFYIKDILYTPFISLSVFKELTNAIRQRINLVNEVNIKNMLSRMMDKTSLDIPTKNYYRIVTDTLKKGNEASECLVYLKGIQNERFLLATEEDENNTSTIKTANVKANEIEFYIPSKYLSAIGFIKTLKESLIDKQHFIYCCQTSVISSACMTIFTDNQRNLIGFVILLNKTHTSIDEHGAYFNNMFFYNNIYITQSCCNYLTHYRNLQKTIYRKNYLLHKLRHEIPGCVTAIEDAMKEMMEKVDDIGYRRNKFKQSATELLMNSNRIDILASFFSAVDFDDSRFLDGPMPFRMQDFINTNLDIYNREAVYKGVCVRCNIGIDTPTLNVSVFYQLALSNLILNAIRYATAGSVVWIRSNSDEITITDIGIGIKDSEKDLIFTEGYRGKAARQIEQRGMGYGLFLAKRILKAYNHPITVESMMVDSVNLFAQNAVYKGYKSLPSSNARDFLLKDAIPGDDAKAMSLLHTISKSGGKIEPEIREFINNDIVSITTWLDYKNRFGPCFLDMDEEIFNREIYKVTFKIKIH